MSSRRNGESSTISPVLFLNVSGEPMRFYIRPGPTKVQLQPVIHAGGGVICRAQDPSVILLADPEDVSSTSTAHFYVSTLYIRDCVEKKEQLELEDYRFKTEHVQTRASRQRREGGSGGGRMGYTSEEDSAILSYISKHERESRGNRVWQDMEKQQVTNHSWQSMKDRYRKHLSHRTAQATSEKRPDTPKRDTPKSSPSHNQPASPGPLPESDSPEPGSKPETEHSEPAPELEIPEQEPGPEVPEPTPEPEVLNPAPNSDLSKTVSEEELTAPDTADLPQAASEPPAELSVESEVLPSLRPVGVPEGEDSPSKQQRRATRQRSQSGPSSSTPVAKRARAGSPAAGEDKEKEESVSSGGNAGPFIQRQTEPQRRKKTSKTRHLGILEKASREFEESEESEDETPDIEEGSAASPPPASPPEASATGRVTQNPGPITKDPAPITQTESPDESAAVDTEPQPNLQGRSPEAQGSSEVDPTEVAAPGPRPGPGEPLLSTSAAHMFLFDNESQEVETSQPIRDEVPFTQLQVEETKRIIKGLMKRTNKDLVEVTKALLKTSGDLSEGLLCLTNGKGAEPLWDYRDDELLLSADPSKLHKKYGERGVAKRLAFLDTE